MFISTCLSVGYADISRGRRRKAIASAVMTFGPAMSGALLDEPKQPGSAAAVSRAESIAVQRVIVDKLEAILTELRASREKP